MSGSSKLQSSIGKKQVVAVTGLALVLFITGHLAGNLLFFLGPEAFNSYAEHLKDLRPGLNVVEAGLALIFMTHITVTLLLVRENLRARPARYLVERFSEQRSLATRLMPLTGMILVIFVVRHLRDFTFADHEGLRSVLSDGRNYGLYGLVWNSFQDPVHSLFYIIAMFCLGLHLSHGLGSFVQTLGLCPERSLPRMKRASSLVGAGVAVLFSSIPVYVLLSHG